MHQPTDTLVPKFYKLTTGEDIVAYELEDTETHILIKQPMAIVIENNFMAAKQLLNVREWIPPIVAKNDQVNLPKTLIMFSLEVNDEFKHEFATVVSYFYGVAPVKKRPKRERVGSEDKNVIPFTVVKDDSGKVH